MRFFIYYLTFYSFVLLHVLSGVLTKPYVATVTNQTRICAKTEKYDSMSYLYYQMQYQRCSR